MTAETVLVITLILTGHNHAAAVVFLARAVVALWLWFRERRESRCPDCDKPGTMHKKIHMYQCKNRDCKRFGVFWFASDGGTFGKATEKHCKHNVKWSEVCEKCPQVPAKEQA